MKSIEMTDWTVFGLMLLCIALAVAAVLLFVKVRHLKTEWWELRDCCREADAHIIRDVVNLRNYSQSAMEGLAYLAMGQELLYELSDLDAVGETVSKTLAKMNSDFRTMANSIPPADEMVPEWCRVGFPEMFKGEEAADK